MDASDIVARGHRKKGVALASRLATLNATAKGRAAEVIDNPDPDRPIAPVAGQRIRQLWQFLTRAFPIFCGLRRRRRSDGRVLIFRMVVR